MLKRIVGITIAVVASVAVALISFGVWKTTSERPSFAESGYILQGDSLGSKQISFTSDTVYTISQLGEITFLDTAGDSAAVTQESFVHFDDGSVMAMCGGVLMDFADLSDNFINNYYISAKLPIYAADGEYTAETTAGTIAFGENLWKISDEKYLIQSPTLTVSFSDSDVREISGYVQVSISADGIVHILTPDNIWATISESCFIETAGGVQINPVTQLITDGTYVMSMAKLSVDADDKIVLTEDETRRQIVPELNFEVIDGEDGADGDNGNIGTMGINGESGIDGESGTDGELGADGEAGVTGEDGELGTTGATGEDGSAGSGGSSGSSGDDGASGTPGASGSTGADAVSDSSTNSALPTMTITKWDLSPTSLAGTISIVDANEYLVSYNGTYPMTVTIYNNDTGATVACYPATYTSATGMYTWETYTDFYTNTDLSDGAEVYFVGNTSEYVTTATSSLSPNTSYQLVVQAYYTMNTDIYSRKFIDETFYTDSAGVYVTKELVRTNAINVDTVVSSAYQDSVYTAEVVLMTKSQSDSYTVSSGAGTYIYKYVLDYKTGTISGYNSDGSTYTYMEGSAVMDGTSLFFSGLDSDSNYYIRVEVEGYGYDTLTDQILQVTTLTQTPTWSGNPSADYNRATGQVDVYPPTVDDPDGCVTGYVYTPYMYDTTTEEWVELTSQAKTVTSQSGGSVSFTLADGTYYFQITLETYNNEQTVEYNLGNTEAVTVSGGSLPGLTLVGEYVEDYDKYTGTLYISIPTGTTFSISNSQPLKVVIQGDLLTAATLSFDTLDVTVTSGAYSGVLTKNAAGTGYEIAFTFDPLLKNTSYTLTTSAYLDFGLDNGTSLYELGTVSIRTVDTPAVTVNWLDSGDASSGSAVSQAMSLSINTTSLSDSAADNATTQAANGQVTLELTNSSSSRVQGTALITGNDLDDLYGSGLTVTESTFGKSDIDESLDWTISVTEVADESVFSQNSLGYYNTFDDITRPSYTVDTNAALPALLASPDLGITATAVTVADIGYYNLQSSYYDGYPDETIIGYALQSTFDNSDRIGETLTYYAFEMSTFYNTVETSGSSTTFDISDSDSPVTPVATVDVDILNSATIPAVVMLFGDSPSGTTGSQYGVADGGESTYYVGDAVTTGSDDELESGMERGYYYLFAYTATVTGETEAYPKARSDQYTTYMNEVGTNLGVNTSKIGQGRTYMLNSGVQEAPLVEPVFYTYVHSTEEVSYSSVGTTGTVNLMYYYTDADSVVVRNSDDGTDTVISIPKTDTAAAATPSLIAPENWTVADDTWLQVNYSVTAGSTSVVSLTMNLELYKSNYDTVLTVLGMDEEVTYYLTHIPVDTYWGGYSTTAFSDASVGNPVVDSTGSKMTFQFPITNANTNLAGRAYAMQMDFTSATGTKKTLYAAITQSTQGYYEASISPGSLGTDFIGGFTVDVSVLYDNGTQGWALAADEEQFALQRTAGTGDDDVSEFRLDAYEAYYSSNTSTSPSYKLMQQGYSTTDDYYFTLDRLQKNASSPTYDESGTRDSFISGFQYLLTDDGGEDSSKWFYLKEDQYGATYSGYYVVPKGMSSYSLGTKTGTLSVIVPTVEYTASRVYSATSVGLSLNDYEVSSYTAAEVNGTGDYAVTAKVFYETDGAIDYTKQLGDSKVMTLNSSGGYVYEDEDDDDGTWVLDPPDEDKSGTFYLVLYMTINGTETILLTKSGDQAIFTFTFASDVAITVKEDLTYINTSYLDKYLYMQYSLNREEGVTPQYDLVQLNNGATIDSYTEADIGIVISHADLLDQGWFGGTMLPTTGDLSSTAVTVNITLQPSALMDGLEPGATYYLRIQMFDAGDSATNAGEGLYAFKIPMVVYTGATVNVVSASANNLSFEVTIVDPEYSLMGDTPASARAGYYAVRLVDADGNKITSDYDDALYYAGNPSQLFSFDYGGDDNTIDTALVAEKFYSLQVYAVPDPEFDGKSPVVLNSDTPTAYSEASASDLFTSGETTYFTNVVDVGWESTGTYSGQPSDMYGTIYDTYCIYELGQKVADTDTPLIGTVSWNRSSLRYVVTLSNSFNIVTVEASTNTETCYYDEIRWYYSGTDSSGSYQSASGISLAADGEAMFASGTSSSGATIYTYEIPYDLDTGDWYMTIQLYKNDVLQETFSNSVYSG